MASCPSLSRAIAHIFNDETKVLVLDLRRLTFLDSTGIRAVLIAQELCDRSMAASSR